jgi:hypothetical protein
MTNLFIQISSCIWKKQNLETARLLEQERRDGLLLSLLGHFSGGEFLRTCRLTKLQVRFGSETRSGQVSFKALGRRRVYTGTLAALYILFITVHPDSEAQNQSFAFDQFAFLASA